MAKKMKLYAFVAKVGTETNIRSMQVVAKSKKQAKEAVNNERPGTNFDEYELNRVKLNKGMGTVINSQVRTMKNAETLS